MLYDKKNPFILYHYLMFENQYFHSNINHITKLCKRLLEIDPFQNSAFDILKHLYEESDSNTISFKKLFGILCRRVEQTVNNSFIYTQIVPDEYVNLWKDFYHFIKEYNRKDICRNVMLYLLTEKKVLWNQLFFCFYPSKLLNEKIKMYFTYKYKVSKYINPPDYPFHEVNNII